MLVVVGANGRTGVEIVREAVRRGRSIRAVVRDDRDARNLDDVLDVQHISYADPDQPGSLPAAMTGASEVIIAIDPRTAGAGSPLYSAEASSNVVRAAHDAGATAIIYLSVMGAFRWSSNRLNRKAFHMDRGVRAQDAPWTVLRVSTYIDEIVEGHVRPPDGGRAHPIKRSSRYSPVSRRDVASMALDYLPKATAGRQVCVGGPEVFTGPELETMLQRWRKPSSRRTRCMAVPRGDISVMPDSTRVTVGWVPRDHLNDFLDPSNEPAPRDEPPPVYARPDPGPHAADRGQNYKVLAPWSDALRRVVHSQLVADLPRLGLAADNVSLDFSRARASKGARSATAHDGEFTALGGIRVVDTETDIAIHTGGVDFVRDVNAEEFHCWWKGSGIPEAVWLELDLGVQRRMVKAGHWDGDPLIETFRAQNG
ncbi:MAG: NAD(P)H-binding protein [Myxococcota bacterium]|nr:NAD(P)H-binding protein [Myxococcota bacterium]